MNTAQPKRRLLARIVALTLALGASVAGAQTTKEAELEGRIQQLEACLLYTSPSPRD